MLKAPQPIGCDGDSSEAFMNNPCSTWRHEIFMGTVVVELWVWGARVPVPGLVLEGPEEEAPHKLGLGASEWGHTPLPQEIIRQENFSLCIKNKKQKMGFLSKSISGRAFSINGSGALLGPSSQLL